MPEILPAIRKAAVLVSCLDRAQADALLESMPAEQAAEVRRAMLELEEIGADEQESVIQEFVLHGGDSMAKAAPAINRGVELSDGLAQRLSTNSWLAERHNANEVSAELHREPFAFLHDADAAQLATFLRHERPQTVALVLSYLPAEQGARIATGLPQPLQEEVLRRLANLDEASPEVLPELEAALRERIESDERNRQRRSAGLAIVARILDAAEPQRSQPSRQAIADEVDAGLVSVNDHQVANASNAQASSALTWEEFESWAAPRAAAALLAAPRPLALLALAGASPGFYARLRDAWHPADAEYFARATMQLGPTRLSDVYAAQQQLAEQLSRAQS